MKKIQLYTPSFFSEMREIKDPEADALIREIYTSESMPVFYQLFGSIQTNKDASTSKNTGAFDAFLDRNCRLPEWADVTLMKKGATFFSKHSEDILRILGLYSLPYCYAAANGAEVLMFSQKIRNNPQKRFLDTAEFLMDVMAPNAFQPRGKAIVSILKTRILHAYIRYQIEVSNKWDDQWGPPINQEDKAATNLTFSFIVFRGLKKLGKSISESELKAYLHLWNVVGYFLGIDQRLLPDTLKEAFIIDKIISKRQFKNSYAGRTLTDSLVGYLKTSVPAEVNKHLIPLYMRFFLGEAVSDLLGIEDVKGSKASVSGFNSLNNILSFFRSKEGYYRSEYFIRTEKRKMNANIAAAARMPV